jgi:hypothetical protein
MHGGLLHPAVAEWLWLTPAWLVQVPAWSTCGEGVSTYEGMLSGANSSVCCPLETSCRLYNSFYWQCMPDDYEPLAAEPVMYDATCTGTKVRAYQTTADLNATAALDRIELCHIVQATHSSTHCQLSGGCGFLYLTTKMCCADATHC